MADIPFCVLTTHIVASSVELKYCKDKQHFQHMNGNENGVANMKVN